MDFSKLLIYGVVGFLVLKFLQYGLTWINLMKRRFTITHHEWIDSYDLPKQFSSIWEQSHQALAALGFQYAFSERSTENQNSISQIYIHPEVAVFAIVSPTRLSGWIRSFDMILVSLFDNGKQLITTDCLDSIRIAYPKYIQTNTLYIGDLNEQWQKHLESVNQIKTDEKTEPIYCTIEQYLAIENKFEQNILSHLVKNGLAVPTGEKGAWRYSAIGAIKILPTLFSAIKKLKSVSQAKKTKLSYQPTNITTDLPVINNTIEAAEQAQIVADIAAFERSIEYEQKKTQWGWVAKSGLFLISVVVASLAFGMAFSWKTVVILLSVLLIHELGHLIGMRIFGFKDTQILFLPFLGAVTIGDKEDATPLQRLIIYLLGPVPGIIGGFIAGYIYLVTRHQIWYEIALMAIILNYINLLPILPLDGGRVLEALIFIRFPRAQTVLYIVNSLVLVALWWLLNDRLIMFISISFFLAIPQQWLFGAAVTKATKLLPTNHDRPSRLTAIFQVLKQPTFAKLSVPDRHMLTKKLLAHFSNTMPDLKTMIAGSFIYLFMLGLPIYGVIGWVLVNKWGLPKYTPENVVVQKINWEERIKKATTTDQKWDALIEAGDSELSEEDEASKSAEQYYLQALTVAETFQPSDPRYLETLIKLASVASKEEAEKYYLQALDHAEKVTNPNSAEVAKVLEELSSLDSISTEKRIQYLERALHIRENPAASSNTQTKSKSNSSDDNLYEETSLERLVISDSLSLAKLYEDSKDFTKAEDLLKQLLVRVNTSEKLQDQKPYITERLADFYIAQGQITLARQLLTERLSLSVSYKSPQTNLYEGRLVTRLAWICVLDKDLVTANKLFDQALREEKEKIKPKSKSIITWLASKVYGVQSDYILISYLLDLSYVQIQQGNIDAAKLNFNQVKTILNSSKFSNLEKYYQSNDRNIQFSIKAAKKKDTETQIKDKALETEDKKGFQQLPLPAIDLADPIVEKLRQTDWQFQRNLAHKEVFDKLK